MIIFLSVVCDIFVIQVVLSIGAFWRWSLQVFALFSLFSRLKYTFFLCKCLFSTAYLHFILPEVSRRYSNLLDVSSTQKTRVEEMMCIQAPFRGLSALPENYQMSLTHKGWVSTQRFLVRVFSRKEWRDYLLFCGDENTNIKIHAIKGVMIRFQIFYYKLPNAVEYEAVSIQR